MTPPPLRQDHCGSNGAVQTIEAFRYHWRVWRATGVAAPLSDRGARLYHCYAVLINATVTLLFPLTLLVHVCRSENLRQLCENLTIAICDVMATLKFLNVFYALGKLRAAEAILTETLDVRAAGAYERRTLQRAVEQAKNIFRIFWWIYTAGTLLSVLRVVLFARERSLLYPAWFYWDWRHSDAVYAAVFAYQLFGLIVQAVQDCASDSYPPAYLCILTGHVEALAWRVRQLNATATVAAAAGGMRTAADSLEGNYRELNACVEDHMNIIKLHALIQETLSVTCLAQFVCSALVQCTVALQLQYETDVSSRLLSGIFFGAVTLEALVLCYFGHQLHDESAALMDAFYACNWIGQLPQFRRNLIIIMIRLQTPSSIYAGGYIPVDLRTFLLLMKYAYSAFTLLMRFK